MFEYDRLVFFDVILGFVMNPFATYHCDRITLNIGVVESMVWKEPRPFIEITQLPFLGYAPPHREPLSVGPVIEEQDANPYFTTQYRIVNRIV
jgi:hypothetical protein